MAVEEVAKLPSPDTGRQILKAFVTRKGTRRNLDLDSLAREAAGFGEAIPPEVLEVHLKQLASVRRGTVKLILNLEDGSSTLVDLASVSGEPGEALRRELTESFRSYREEAVVKTSLLSSGREIDQEEAMEQLKALGYVD